MVDDEHISPPPFIFSFLLIIIMHVAGSHGQGLYVPGIIVVVVVTMLLCVGIITIIIVCL